MKTRYRFLEFIKVEEKPKTSIWLCRSVSRFLEFIKVEEKPKISIWLCRSVSRNEALGGVQWYSPWRQYCFFPEMDTVFNVGCLNDINHFIGQLANQCLNIDGAKERTTS